jgi:hypothetical protein
MQYVKIKFASKLQDKSFNVACGNSLCLISEPEEEEEEHSVGYQQIFHL